MELWGCGWNTQEHMHRDHFAEPVLTRDLILIIKALVNVRGSCGGKMLWKVCDRAWDSFALRTAFLRLFMSRSGVNG